MVQSQSQKSMTYGYPHWLLSNLTAGLALPTPSLCFMSLFELVNTTIVRKLSYNGYTDVLIAGTLFHNGCT